eukprot:11394_1
MHIILFLLPICHHYSFHKQMHSLDGSTMGNVLSKEQCISITYRERVESILQIIESKNKLDIYELVETVYGDNNVEEFINDCGIYANNIDDIYMENINKCDIQNCEHIKK